MTDERDGCNCKLRSARSTSGSDGVGDDDDDDDDDDVVYLPVMRIIGATFNP